MLVSFAEIIRLNPLLPYKHCYIANKQWNAKLSTFYDWKRNAASKSCLRVDARNIFFMSFPLNYFSSENDLLRVNLFLRGFYFVPFFTDFLCLSFFFVKNLFEFKIISCENFPQTHLPIHALLIFQFVGKKR